MMDTEALDVLGLMRRLASIRPVFHSEADFQFALAWLVQSHYPQAQVRLEVPIRRERGRQALDILVSVRNRRIGVELKYLTRRVVLDLGGEHFELADQGAQDISRYDVLKDVVRLETWVASGAIDEGLAITLTNDPAYWTLTTREVAYREFALHPERVLEGRLAWGPTAGRGTTRGREAPIELSGRYWLEWHPYSSLPVPRYAELRFLYLGVLGKV
jgi:hypothetical protein